MESVDTSNSQAKSFFGTFVLFYAVLNILAFFILLLTTKWSMLTDDGGSLLMAGVIFYDHGHNDCPDLWYWTCPGVE